MPGWLRILRFLNTARRGSTQGGKSLLMGVVIGALFAPLLVGWCQILILTFEHFPILALGLVATAAAGLTPEGGLRVAVYARVSTEDQAKKGFSLDAQVERCRIYAALWGYVIVDVYIDDGYSGRKERRPAYQRMMAESEKWDAILVMKIDRVHRNSRNFMNMVEFIQKEGKQFISVTEHLDTTSAMGRFVMYIIQQIAVLESDQIGERTRVANAQRRRQHKCWANSDLWGYDRVEFTTDRPDVTVKNLVPNAWAQWVLQIFRHYVNGSTTTEIATWMNGQIKAPWGGKWREKRIALVLSHEGYIGIRMSPDRADTGNHEGIVPVELFVAAQARMAARRKYVRNEQMSEAWLAARAAAIAAVARGEEYHGEF